MGKRFFRARLFASRLFTSGHWTGTGMLVPNIPGVELSVGWQRPHQSVPNTRPHCALGLQRPHYQVVDTRPHCAIGWQRPHYEVREES